MKNTLRFSLLASALAISAFSAHAASPVEKTTGGPLPRVLQGPADAGLKVHKSFEGPSGLTGYVVQHGTQKPGLVFVTPDGKTLVTGAIFDADGKNLTPEFADQHLPKPDYEKAWVELDKMAYAVDGNPKSKNIVYVFADANCVFCNYAYQAFKPYVDTGKVQVRYVMVGFLKADSMGKAVSILSAKNQAAALAENEEKFKSGGIKASTVTPEMKAKLDANGEMMRRLDFSGTPAILWKGKDGKVKAVGGMPKLGQLPEIFNMPEIKNGNPELARFR